MPTAHTNDAGDEVMLYTPEELEKAKEEATKPHLEELGKTKEEIEKLKRVNVEQTQNFKKYNDMTAEERAAYDTNTVEILKRNDAISAELEETKKQLSEKEQREKEYAKNTILKEIHSGDEKLKATIEDAYAKVNLPETTPDEIRARAELAMKIAGISVKSQNPLYGSLSGEAPNFKSDKEKEFVETERGKSFYEALNNK